MKRSLPLSEWQDFKVADIHIEWAPNQYPESLLHNSHTQNKIGDYMLYFCFK